MRTRKKNFGAKKKIPRERALKKKSIREKMSSVALVLAEKKILTKVRLEPPTFFKGVQNAHSEKKFLAQKKITTRKSMASGVSL